MEKLDEDEDALIIVRKMQEEIGLIDHIDTKLQVYALHILLLFKKRQFKEARSYANEALEITRTCNRPEQALEIYTLLGAIYKECGDLYEAEEYYLYALDLEELVSNEHLLATPYMRLGELYSLKEDWNRAKKMLDKAEKISRETEDPFRHMEVLELYGDYYIRRNELQEAIPYYEQVWDYEERLHPEQPLPEVREKLAFCYRAVNDPKFHKIVARMLELDVQLKLKITKGVNNMPHHSMKLAGDPPND
ncbi:tetratricopeptide repeat protein [Laceyella sediminis]|uniref:Tetratricopeptide repeat protein n=1 Tax=Laceyella sediminis TaxID=573074 RepID=A0ABX5EMT4_9BACL|nr:tetratricopeptide repeat protein [Laceyella sediminis]PRZ12356.1 tetratricopeptide repeat protein [Laceyella sediminis]